MSISDPWWWEICNSIQARYYTHIGLYTSTMCRQANALGANAIPSVITQSNEAQPQTSTVAIHRWVWSGKERMKVPVCTTWGWPQLLRLYKCKRAGSRLRCQECVLWQQQIASYHLPGLGVLWSDCHGISIKVIPNNVPKHLLDSLVITKFSHPKRI